MNDKGIPEVAKITNGLIWLVWREYLTQWQYTIQTKNFAQCTHYTNISRSKDYSMESLTWDKKKFGGIKISPMGESKGWKKVKTFLLTKILAIQNTALHQLEYKLY